MGGSHKNNYKGPVTMKKCSNSLTKSKLEKQGNIFTYRIKRFPHFQYAITARNSMYGFTLM